MQVSEKTFAEIIGVLVAGLLLFMATLRYVSGFIQKTEKRRSDLFDKYEAALIENVRLKGQLQLNRKQMENDSKTIKFYSKELAKYKTLYKSSIDKGTAKK